MKKQEQKKLTLNRETVVNLEKLELKKVAAAFTRSAPSSPATTSTAPTLGPAPDTWQPRRG
jgi:hypothetical protein